MKNLTFSKEQGKLGIWGYQYNFHFPTNIALPSTHIHTTNLPAKLKDKNQFWSEGLSVLIYVKA
jgi:hypothetical protein